MSFSFGAPPKTATGFTLPSSSAPATTTPGFSLGGGAAGDTSKSATNLFSPSSSYGFGNSDNKTAQNLSFGSKPTAPSFGTAAATSSAAVPSFGFGAAAATAPPSFGAAAATAPPSFGATAVTAPPSFGFGQSAPPATTLSFGLGASSTATTTAAPSFSFPAGSVATAAPTFGLGLASSTAPVSAPALNFSATSLATNSVASTPAGGLSFGAPTTTATNSAAPLQFGFSSNLTPSAPKTTAVSFTPIGSSGLSASTSITSSSESPATKLSFKPATTAVPASSALSFAPASSASIGSGSASAVSTSISLTPSTTTATTTTTTAATSGTTGAPTSLTYFQLEDLINKWSVELEEQSKVFVNQSKQLNAWDLLLISNGDKVLQLSTAVERVKQEQQQLEQELDFITAQQKELEEPIEPLEKELGDVPVTDQERNHTYQLAEKLDAQLKQMSDDLKEIIENLNESNKSDELSDPITQVCRIMNAHMNSLQWIDRNTAQISSQLEQVSKLQDLNRRNNSFYSSH